MIAAAHSGAGKTTVTLGLLALLKRKGYHVQPFKCGPDYIDPIHHRSAAGRDSINLDRYMMSDHHIRGLFDRYGSVADISITEGVMGLYDGAQKTEGSSSDLAQLLGIPVILVLNAKAMAYSAAAILFGMKNFDPGIRIAGVIFNFVETASHYRFLREAAEDTGITPLGFLPTEPALRIPSRHLGLDTREAETAIAAAADHLEKHLDWESLLQISNVQEKTGAGGRTEDDRRPGKSERQRERPSGEGRTQSRPGNRTILVARDEAFHFLYPENIRLLEKLGTLIYFSPLHDQRLPVNPDRIDLVYLPGGYPELHLTALAGNTGMREGIGTYYKDGGKLLAECGGMMYLGKYIVDQQGKSYPMVDILDLATSMEEKKLHLGYRTVLLGKYKLKGHEFHYSQKIAATDAQPAKGSGVSGAVTDGESPFRLMPADSIVYNARQERVDTPVYYSERILASYMHIYWGEEPGLIAEWLHQEPKIRVSR